MGMPDDREIEDGLGEASGRMTTGDGIAVAAKVAGACFIAWLVGPVMVAGLLKLLLCCAVILFFLFQI